MFDAIETELPPAALYAVSDGEQQTLLNTGDNKLRSAFEQAFIDRSQKLKRVSQELSAGLLPFNSAESVMSVLAQAYGKRRKGRRS